MARRYAKGTDVPADRSRLQIERLLKQNGATGFMYGWDGESRTTRLFCRLDGHLIRFEVSEPHASEFEETEKGRSRTPESAERACRAEARRRWRVLLLLIKAKLEAIASGDTTVDREFLSDLVLPDKRTVGEWAARQIQVMRKTGEMPSLLIEGR